MTCPAPAVRPTPPLCPAAFRILHPALLCLLTLLLPALVRAATLNVPAQYQTIQAGVNAAVNGDTVLVADGTYSGPGNRDIDFHGKSLTVASQHGPASTIIDCGGSKSTDGSGNHRGFYIHSGEKTATISGFTVKNGYETNIDGVVDSGCGGGIYNENGIGTISVTKCILSGNTACYCGGGIYNYNYDTGRISMTNCTVSGNTISISGGKGGGIYNYNFNGTISMKNCSVSGNTASYASTDTVNYGQGGGIYNANSDTDDTGGTISVMSCSVSGNKAGYGGGGIYNINSASAGTRDAIGTISVTNCVVSGNAVSSAKMGSYDYGGGGIQNNNYSNGAIIITNCTLSGNTARIIGNSKGGCIYNNNCSGTIVISNCIVYGDQGVEIVDYTSSLASADHCDIQGGYPGTGNIDKNPLFVNAASGNLRLKPNSPCLGAGTASSAPTKDRDGRLRRPPPSMGAYESASAGKSTGKREKQPLHAGRTAKISATALPGRSAGASEPRSRCR